MKADGCGQELKQHNFHTVDFVRVSDDKVVVWRVCSMCPFVFTYHSRVVNRSIWQERVADQLDLLRRNPEWAS
jgi:hypothetical protein